MINKHVDLKIKFVKNLEIDFFTIADSVNKLSIFRSRSGLKYFEYILNEFFRWNVVSTSMYLCKVSKSIALSFAIILKLI